jgi:hypothetical protein
MPMAVYLRTSQMVMLEASDIIAKGGSWQWVGSIGQCHFEKVLVLRLSTRVFGSACDTPESNSSSG